MVKRIGDWTCADVDDLRVATRGEDSASFAVSEGFLLSFGKIPKEVVEWLIRPVDPALPIPFPINRPTDP